METLSIDELGRIIDSDGDPIPLGPHWVPPEKTRRWHLESNVQAYTRGGGKLFWADERREEGR